ncbi:MAG: hypothetical protein WDN50_14930 [Bradyrhizobium sp.]
MDVAKTRHGEVFARLLLSSGGFLAAFAAAGFTKNYALACFDRPENFRENPATRMTLSVTHSAERANSLRGLLPLWVGVFVYVLLVLAGNSLLRDPDTMWHITVGQWMLDNHAVPHTDIYSLTMRGQPWISMQWVAEVLYAKAYSLFGWSGPVALAAAGSALTFALLTKFLTRHLNDSTALVFVAAALALTMGHLLARPHVLALPVMIAWVGGLIDAADRRAAPSFWLLPLITLWANLHGGFILGLMLGGPIALDAVVGADAASRKSLALRWAIFGLAALVAACCTPYGWNSMLASKNILSLGSVLLLISEWLPADFSSLGAFEICLLMGLGMVLLYGIKLPPTRILLLLGLLHMALAQGRSAETLALLGPMVLAVPLARQIGGAEASSSSGASMPRGLLFAGIAIVLMVATLAYGSVVRFKPDPRQAPVAAVAVLKQMNLTRVLNDYDFGSYLIANGVAPFIDGRTDLYGEKFFIDHNNAIMSLEPNALFRLLDEYKIEAVLLRTTRPGPKLLDHVDGWQKVYSDDIATLHVRVPGAMHTAEPPVK